MDKCQFWLKLNRKPLAVYLRFQRLFAKRNGGKWIRGYNVTEDKFVLE